MAKTVQIDHAADLITPARFRPLAALFVSIMFGVLQRTEALTFLRSYVGADDWLALLLKDHVTGKAVQWVGSLRRACSDRTQAWICERNAAGYGVFASVNALSAGARSRRKADIAAVRHVLLDVDRDAHKVLASLKVRQAIPPPTCVVHTSPGRVHVLWRIRECDVDAVERIQKGLALSFGGDPAATSVAQMTRLPGFRNHKYATPYVVWVDYLDVEHVYTPGDFPPVDGAQSIPPPAEANWPALEYVSPAKRAQAYLSHVPPAVAGHHGDLHTFQACCRVVRGFALDDDQALAVLAEWNARCQPPWTQRELLQKIRSARRNGREPIGGLL